MKMRSFIIIALILSTTIAYAHERRLPKLVDVGVSEVFIPTGFDDNDNVEVILEGYFPNHCYQTAPARVEKLENNKIQITPQAYLYQGPCLQAIVRYKSSVGLRDHIGFLNEGSYDVIVKGYPNISKLTVKHSHNDGPDDFPYASVDEIGISSYEPLKLNLKGKFLDHCFDIDKIIVLEPVNQVISVLPIIKHDETKPCAQKIKNFSVDIAIEEELKKKIEGRYLFHVRSAEGSSKNLIESF